MVKKIEIDTKNPPHQNPPKTTTKTHPFPLNFDKKSKNSSPQNLIFKATYSF